MSWFIWMVWYLTVRAYIIAQHMPVVVYALVLGVV